MHLMQILNNQHMKPTIVCFGEVPVCKHSTVWHSCVQGLLDEVTQLDEVVCDRGSAEAFALQNQ